MAGARRRNLSQISPSRFVRQSTPSSTRSVTCWEWWRTPVQFHAFGHPRDESLVRKVQYKSAPCCVFSVFAVHDNAGRHSSPLSSFDPAGGGVGNRGRCSRFWFDFFRRVARSVCWPWSIVLVHVAPLLFFVCVLTNTGFARLPMCRDRFCRSASKRGVPHQQTTFEILTLLANVGSGATCRFAYARQSASQQCCKSPKASGRATATGVGGRSDRTTTHIIVLLHHHSWFFTVLSRQRILAAVSPLG